MADAQETIGRKLRQLRVARGITLRQLADQVGRSESYLSRVERGQLDLSLSTLKSIADQLGSPVLGLLDEGYGPPAGLIRRGEHRRLIVSPQLEYEILCVSNRDVSVFRMTLGQGGNSGDRPYCHKGIEAGVLLRGSVRVVVGENEFVLGEGDSLTYPSDKPHWFENVGSGEAVAVWVVAPPTF